MLDIKHIRNNIEAVSAGLARRGVAFDAVGFQRLDEQRRNAETQMQELLAERKQASKEIGRLVKEGVPVDEAKSRVEQSLARIERQLDTLKDAAREAQEAMDGFLLAVPNLPAAEVPAGDSEDDNVEVSRWSEPPAFDFEPADHVDIAERLNLIDFDAAAKLTGSRFVVLKGPLARLHRALIQLMLDLHTGAHGYTEVNVPYIVNADSLLGTGQLPKFAEDLFRLEGDHGYYLIPTAEVPVTNLLRDEIVETLPLRFAAHTPCFRSEAGSYGRDTRGMIRQHQFEKVELVQFVSPAESDCALEELTGHAEAVLRALGLAYRKVVLCGGDLGFSARKTYDLEVWLPGQQRYREISSCSNFGDFQARRMRARWRNPQTGKPEYLHTLNGSGLAVGRALVAVLENYQRADGSVVLPDALRPYMGGAETL